MICLGGCLTLNYLGYWADWAGFSSSSITSSFLQQLPVLSRSGCGRVGKSRYFFYSNCLVTYIKSTYNKKQIYKLLSSAVLNRNDRYERSMSSSFFRTFRNILPSLQRNISRVIFVTGIFLRFNNDYYNNSVFAFSFLTIGSITSSHLNGVVQLPEDKL